MIRVLLHRFVTLWLAVTIAFIAFRVMPGEALRAELVLGGADEESIAAQRAALGLDRSAVVLYFEYMGGLMRGDLGVSVVTRQSVAEMLAVNLPPTLALALAAFVVAVTAGWGLGVMAVSPRLWGRLARAWMALLLSVPIYWSGTLAIYVFAVLLNWLPSGGTGGVEHLLLPSLVLGVHTSVAIGRAIQLALTEAFHAEYIRTARAKGLTERRVLIHALRASCVPIITTMGLQGGFLLGGTVITEMLFVRNGIGRMMLDAAQRRDYTVLLGGVLFTTTAYITVNTLADVVNRWLDPRVRAL